MRESGSGNLDGSSKREGATIEFISAYYIEIIISVVLSAITSVIFHFAMIAKDQKSLSGEHSNQYTVFWPVAGRVAMFSISMFGLFLAILFFRKPSAEAFILGSVSLGIFLFMQLRTWIACAWNVKVQDDTMTICRFLRKPRSAGFDEITLVSSNSRGYSVYSGTEELFNFSLGKRKDDPGTYRLQKELEERDKWIHH